MDTDPLNRAAPSDDIDHLIEQGAAAHPLVAPPPGLRAFVAARAEAALAAEDRDRRGADLYLAAACAAADAAAIASLDAILPDVVKPALARLGLPPSDDDEVIQRVRVALLTGDKPGIAGYSGRGELRTYLRAVAVRTALKKIERERGPSPGDDHETLAMFPDAADSPALRVLKARCRGELRAAFAQAFGALAPRERTLLRQHYLDGLSIDALAPLYRVHRATCARWIEAARDNILAAVRRNLREALGLDAGELDSALALVRSQLDLSLSRHLARTVPD